MGTYDPVADSANADLITRAGVMADDPSVVGLTRLVASDFALCRSTPQGLATVVVRVRDALHAIRSNADISPVKMQRDTADARTQGKVALDALQTQATEAADRIKKTLGQILAPPANEDPTVSELQIASAWSVAQPFVATAGGLNNSVATLMSSGVPGMAAALRRYLPLVLRAHFRNEPESRITSYVEAAMRQVDAAETPTLSALQQAARKYQQQLTEGMGLVQAAYNFAVDEVVNGNAHSVLPGFDRDTVPVAEGFDGPGQAFANCINADAIRRSFPYLIKQ